MNSQDQEVLLKNLKALAKENNLDISAEIAKIEQEIESILKEEDTMWAEYKQAKEDAKKRKQEYLAEKKIEKEQSKKQTSKENKTKIDKKQYI